MLLLMVINGMSLFSWVKKDTNPLAWDQSTHTNIAFDYRDRFQQGPVDHFFRPVEWNYPPLYHLMLAPTVSYFSDVTDASSVINYFYLCLLILMVFLIGKKMMDAWVGFTAAAMVTCYPIVVELSRNTLIDLSLIAWVSVGFYCLHSSENFSKLRGSVLFGVSLGLAMLTKWTALAYFLFPLIPSLWKALRLKNIRNIFISFGISFLLMAPWYVQNFVPMMIRIPKLSGLPPASGTHMSGLANIFWYPLSFGEQMGLIFLLLSIPGLVVVFWKPKLRPLFLWFLGTLVLFSLIRNRNTRYFAPALPAVALLTASSLSVLTALIERRRPPSSLSGVATLTSQVAVKSPYLIILFVTAMIFWGANVQGTMSRSYSLLWQSARVLEGRSPLPYDWKHQEITEKIRELNGDRPKPPHVLVASNHPFFFGQSLHVSMRSKGIVDVAFHGARKRRPFEFNEFVLVKTGDLGPVNSLKATNACLEVINTPNSWFLKSYKQKAKWDLPEGAQGILYQFDPTPQQNAEPSLINLELKELELPHISATDVVVSALPHSKADTALGRFKLITLQASRITYKGVVLRDVKVKLIEPQINLPYFSETQEIQLARLGALEPQATIQAEDLLALLEKKAKWLQSPQISFEGSFIRVAGNVFGIPISVALEVQAQNNIFSTRLQRLAIAGLPLPRVLFRGVTDRDIKLNRGEDWAYDIQIPQIKGTGSQLRLGI